MLNLAEAFTARGHRVDLLVCRLEGAHKARVPAGVRVVTLERHSLLMARYLALRANRSAWKDLLRPVLLARRGARALRCLHSLVRYLRAEGPQAMLSGKTHTNLVAIWARQLAGAATRLVISEHSSLSQEIAGPKGRKWRWRFVAPLVGRAYQAADAVVAVSEGVADDLSAQTGLPRVRTTTIYNPVFSPRLLELARAPISHPWYKDEEPPLLLGVGRLEPQKDFALLVRAFARIRRERAVRLLILGEGRERSRLTQLAEALGVADSVDFPGFVPNPYAHMARANLFVLSSRYEGLGNVVIEALACGCPVVSTDCPSGPAEILDQGRYGRLVPVGDAKALAQAILAALEEPVDPDRLRGRAAQFSVERAARRYLKLMGGDE
jgi:glycosyltransferase involved in cell wall biosynthesis